MNEKVKHLWERYKELCHAMQTGVAFTSEFEPKELTPKHLRVGVNSALVNSSALVKLLIQKGVITEEEYAQVLCEQMQEEVKDYESRLAAVDGVDVKLF